MAKRVGCLWEGRMSGDAGVLPQNARVPEFEAVIVPGSIAAIGACRRGLKGCDVSKQGLAT